VPSSAKGEAVSVEENKAVARRFVEEVWNGGNLAVAEELLAPGLVDHGPGGGTTDREGFLAYVREFRAAFPDLRFTIDDMLGEGDKVATRVSVRGTQAAPFRGAAPTGEPRAWTGIGIVRVADGRIVEQWADTSPVTRSG